MVLVFTLKLDKEVEDVRESAGKSRLEWLWSNNSWGVLSNHVLLYKSMLRSLITEFATGKYDWFRYLESELSTGSHGFKERER